MGLCRKDTGEWGRNPLPAPGWEDGGTGVPSPPMEAPDFDWIHLAETDSTNRWAADWLRREGGRSGRPAVILADRQGAGRGQFGRPWWSAAGRDLTMTFAHPAPALRADTTPAHWSMVWAMSVREALAPFSAAELQIKWPNDLLAATPAGDWAKLGGILVENHWQGGKLAGVLIGVGVNLAQPPAGADFRAVGLEELRTDPAGLSPEEVGRQVAAGLACTFRAMPPPEQIVQQYLMSLHGFGEIGVYTRQGERHRGVIRGFSTGGEAQFDWLD